MKKTLISLALSSILSIPAMAADFKAGDILVRGGLTAVSPSSDKAPVYANGNDTGLTVTVDNNTQLGLNFVYFFDQNWALEVLAATPFTHDIQVQTPAGEAKLASVKHLPPTISALYYFNTDSIFKPYVGLGLNYTVFFQEEFSSTFKTAGYSDLDLDSSFGYSLQLGADVELSNNWYVNASARYIDIDTDANFKLNSTINGSANVAIDPMVYSVMVGYKF